MGRQCPVIIVTALYWVHANFHDAGANPLTNTAVSSGVDASIPGLPLIPPKLVHH